MEHIALKSLLVASAIIYSSIPAAAESRYCREYTKTITVGGKPQEQGYGTACMQPDGSWEIVSTNEAAPEPEYVETYTPMPVRTVEYIEYPRPVYIARPQPAFSVSFGSYGSSRHYHGKKHYYRDNYRGHRRGHRR